MLGLVNIWWFFLLTFSLTEFGKKRKMMVLGGDTWSESNVDVNDYFLDDNPWVICRKIIEGTNGYFGVGYNFTVMYELTNIGTSEAKNL
ncbi:hypothetical protein RFI_17230, partial [Reticulomyxa filosa]